MERALRLVGVSLLLASAFALPAAVPAGHASAGPAAVLPSGFHDQVVVSGLDRPTAVRFAPDGAIFVAEQSGKIVVLDGLGAAPKLFADLSE